MSWAHPETSSRKTLWNIDSGLSKFTRSCAHPQASWGQKRAERASGVTTVLGLLRCGPIFNASCLQQGFAWIALVKFTSHAPLQKVSAREHIFMLQNSAAKCVNNRTYRTLHMFMLQDLVLQLAV